MQWTDRIGRRLKLHDLHVLMTVIDAGSMGRAARRLNTSQPAISRSIAELEHTFGVRLLDRGSQGVEPTKHGRALVACGIAVFDDLRRGVQAVDFLSDPTVGEVSIAGNEPIIAGLVPAVFNRLRSQYPGITIRARATPSLAQQYSDLRERKVDFVLARTAADADDDLDTEILFNERVYVVVAANNPWLRRRKVKFSDLMDEPWALPEPETLVGDIFREAFRKAGLDYPRRNVALGRIHFQMTLVASGQFLALFPGSVMKYSTDPRLKILRVTHPVPSWPVGIVTLKGRAQSPVAQLFLKHLRDVAKSLTSAV